MSCYVCAFRKLCFFLPASLRRLKSQTLMWSLRSENGSDALVYWAWVVVLRLFTWLSHTFFQFASLKEGVLSMVNNSCCGGNARMLGFRNSKREACFHRWACRKWKHWPATQLKNSIFALMAVNFLWRGHIYDTFDHNKVSFEFPSPICGRTSETCPWWQSPSSELKSERTGWEKDRETAS